MTGFLFDLTEARRRFRAVMKAEAAIDRIERNAEGRDSFGQFAELEKVLIAALRDTEAALAQIEAEGGNSSGYR